MTISIHPRAFKHGLLAEQIIMAVETGRNFARIRERDEGTEPQRWGVIGFDSSGRRLELVLVDVPDGVLIFHANYLTKGFEQEMRNAR